MIERIPITIHRNHWKSGAFSFIFFLILIWAFLSSASTLTKRSESNANLPSDSDGNLYEHCTSDALEFVSPIFGKPKCCKKCQPGEGMLQLCSDESDTICRPCKPGFEYSSVWSATAKCMQCKKCQELHPFARARSLCSPTQDVTCGCISGLYFSQENLSCLPCTQCPLGQGVKKTCGWNHNTVCEICENGNWSSTFSASEPCLPCKKCRSDYLEILKCNASQNSVCCPADDLDCQDEPEDNAVQLDQMFLQRSQTSSFPLIGLYCVLLSLVILTLLVYVVYKVRKQRLSIGTHFDSSAKLSMANGWNGLNSEFLPFGNAKYEQQLKISTENLKTVETQDRSYLPGDFSGLNSGPTALTPEATKEMGIKLTS